MADSLNGLVTTTGTVAVAYSRASTAAVESGAPIPIVALSAKTSVDALAVPMPSPRDMKTSRPVASPVNRASTSIWKESVDRGSSRTYDEAVEKHEAPSRRTA